jgi:hypothetical protein
VYLLACSPQFHHSVPHLDNIGKTYLIQSFGQTHRARRHNCPLSAALLTLGMKSRYLYLAAFLAFLVAAVIELRPPRNITAALLDAAAGLIFLFLGTGPKRRA